MIIPSANLIWPHPVELPARKRAVSSTIASGKHNVSETVETQSYCTHKAAYKDRFAVEIPSSHVRDLKSAFEIPKILRVEACAICDRA
jgi:hypothetical protein